MLSIKQNDKLYQEDLIRKTLAENDIVSPEGVEEEGHVAKASTPKKTNRKRATKKFSTKRVKTEAKKERINVDLGVKSGMVCKVKCYRRNNAELPTKPTLMRMLNGTLKLKDESSEETNVDYSLELKNQDDTTLSENLERAELLQTAKCGLQDDIFKAFLQDKPDIQCTFCGFKKSSVEEMKVHYTEAHNYQSSVCLECRKRFSNDSIAFQHILIGHGHNGRYICPFANCEQEYLHRFGARRHIVRYHATQYKNIRGKCESSAKSVETADGQFYCDVCNMHFSDAEYLFTHQKQLHIGQKPMLCKACNKVFCGRTSIRRHLHAVHRISVIIEEDTKVNDDNSERDDNTRCPLCLEKRGVQALSDHINDHILGNIFTESVPQSSETVQYELFSCPLCERLFESAELFLKHLMYKRAHKTTPEEKQRVLDELHKDPTKYMSTWNLKVKSGIQIAKAELVKNGRLDQTDLFSISVKDYIEKLRLTDGSKDFDDLDDEEDAANTTTFVCRVTDCGRHLNDLQEKLVHDLHDHGRSYICPEDECLSTFVTYDDLHKHVERHMHTSAMSSKVQCPDCKSFLRLHNFCAHKKRCSKGKELACVEPGCGMEFTTLSALSNHKQSHKQTTQKYSCPECKRLFMSKQDLRRHKRVHSGERPFVCDDCKNTFRQRAHLREHMKRVHGNKNPDDESFECLRCNRVFCRKSSYSFHVNRCNKMPQSEELQKMEIVESVPKEIAMVDIFEG